MQQPRKSAKEKLLEKRKALDERIRAVEAREKELERKEDTRRKILAGAVVLEEVERHPEFKQVLWPMLDRFLVRPADRKLFGLTPEAPPGTVVEGGGVAERIEQTADAIEAGIRAA